MARVTPSCGEGRLGQGVGRRVEGRGVEWRVEQVTLDRSRSIPFRPQYTSRVYTTTTIIINRNTNINVNHYSGRQILNLTQKYKPTIPRSVMSQRDTVVLSQLFYIFINYSNLTSLLIQINYLSKIYNSTII